jgi:hypothetical protein
MSYDFPIAQPPAAPPPPPPPSDSDENSVRSAATLNSDALPIHNSNGPAHHAYSGAASYQSYGPRTAVVPSITNYGLSPAQSSKAKIQGHQLPYSDLPPTNGTRNSVPNENGGYNLPMMRGDTTIRPNTGNTNQEIGTMGSLREITSTLRWATIATTLTAVGWEGFAFPARLIASIWVDPARVVLGAYLGIFCLLVLGVELNAPLRDSFGFLYNPLTRGFVLLMMSTMCFGILKSWWESLLGLAFVVCGLSYIFVYVRYPEYRRWQDYNASRPTAWQEARQYWMGSNVRTSVWATPEDGQDRFAWTVVQTSSEARALLHHV